MFDTFIHKRINIVLLVIIFLFVLIIFKVFYIQVIDYKRINKLANGLWSRNLPIESDRGKIITSDGFSIASNLTTVSLIFIPNQIDKDKKKEIAIDIANILHCNIGKLCTERYYDP